VVRQRYARWDEKDTFALYGTVRFVRNRSIFWTCVPPAYPITFVRSRTDSSTRASGYGIRTASAIDLRNADDIKRCLRRKLDWRGLQAFGGAAVAPDGYQAEGFLMLVWWICAVWVLSLVLAGAALISISSGT